MQSRKASRTEALANIGVGFCIALLLQCLVVVPFWDYFQSIELFGFGAGNLFIVIMFTAASYYRSYFVRRFFNWWPMRKLNSRYLYKKQPTIRDLL